MLYVFSPSLLIVDSILTWRWPSSAETCRHRRTNKLRYLDSCVLRDLHTLIGIKHNGDDKPEDTDIIRTVAVCHGVGPLWLGYVRGLLLSVKWTLKLTPWFFDPQFYWNQRTGKYRNDTSTENSFLKLLKWWRKVTSLPSVNCKRKCDCRCNKKCTGCKVSTAINITGLRMGSCTYVRGTQIINICLLRFCVFHLT